MKKKIKLTESQFDVVLRYKILNEYGKKGRWKPEWYKEDQMLAMYNSFYGIQELGMGKEEVANKIIGSSVDAFNQQSSNFDFLDGRGGLDRESYKQEEVYKEYKDVPKQEFKRICLDIIQKRIKNPDPAAERYKLGQEIGSKRDEIQKGREEGLKLAGVRDPKRAKLIGSRPKNIPIEDEPKPSEKEQIQNYLKSIHGRLQNINSKADAIVLANDLEFIIDYIDNELIDKDAGSMVAEITNLFKKRNII
jgi:hypothetical protein